MKRLCLSVLLILGMAPLPYPAEACSLCGSLLNRPTIRNEIKTATVVLYGKLANEKLAQGNGAVGFGTTELHIEKVLKSHSLLADNKMVVLPKYIPILDKQNPPRVLGFF